MDAEDTDLPVLCEHFDVDNLVCAFNCRVPADCFTFNGAVKCKRYADVNHHVFEIVAQPLERRKDSAVGYRQAADHIWDDIIRFHKELNAKIVSLFLLPEDEDRMLNSAERAKLVLLDIPKDIHGLARRLEGDKKA